MKKLKVKLKIDKEQFKKKLGIKDGERGNDGSPDTGNEIVEKINNLPLTPISQIDASHIKNLSTVIQGGEERWGKKGLSSLNKLSGAVDLVAGTNITLTVSGKTITIESVNDATAVWGSITGTLSNQTDLQTALDAKQATLTNSAGLLAALNDETGTGLAVFNTSPALTTPAFTGNPTGTITSGTYTPTRSAEANMDANVTMTEAQYMRVGNTVTVSGRFTADPTTTATTTSFEITLPVASNIGAVEDVAGIAFCGTIASMGAEVIGVVANDTAKIQWVSSDITSKTWSYHFSYQII